MTKYFVLAEYPPESGRSNNIPTSILGALIVGRDGGLDDLSTAHDEVCRRIVKMAKGEDIIDKAKSHPLNGVVTLINGVILRIQSVPVSSLDCWLGRAIM